MPTTIELERKGKERPITCLYDGDTALPEDERGRSPMQPVCARCFDKAGAMLLKGSRGKGDTALVREAIESLGPIFACHRHNQALPCAGACAAETNMLLRIFREQVLYF
ncbi:MAG: hypothetical protein EXR02_09415 [Rhodospirillales bacterium]|nr:hypothetical protein [Rhodospirillales bacterium]